MSEPKKIWEVFEDVVFEILQSHINSPQSITREQNNTEFDFLATIDSNEHAIEVKHYRTQQVQQSLIRQAARRLAHGIFQRKIQHGMLIVSCIIPQEQREALKIEHKINIVDQIELRHWCKSNPNLTEKLEHILGVMQLDPTAVHPLPFTTNEIPPVDGNIAPSENSGSDLSKQLRALRKGRGTPVKKPGSKSNWRKYEELCIKILEYLFSSSTEKFYSQSKTADGLNRFDCVFRIKPETDFWKFLINHLNSFYVVFEFKNYSKKISQGEILTTEKYLFEQAFRRTAIIMTRDGADEGAKKMIQGAMREHGKLIIVIDDNNIIEMLEKKDRGEDPSDYLFDRVDDFLLKLSR